MCKFINLSANYLLTLRYMPDVERCFRKYYKYLQDDFSPPFLCNITILINEKSTFFRVITDFYGKFMGFVYLDNFTGNEKYLYSAELTTCFDRCAWGSFTRYSAKIFLKKCFDELGLYKIKAQIYPENHRVRTLLKNSGFVYEATLKNETLRCGKPQDIEVYSLYRDYYYKTR